MRLRILPNVLVVAFITYLLWRIALSITVSALPTTEFLCLVAFVLLTKPRVSGEKSVLELIGTRAVAVILLFLVTLQIVDFALPSILFAFDSSVGKTTSYFLINLRNRYYSPAILTAFEMTIPAILYFLMKSFPRKDRWWYLAFTLSLLPIFLVILVAYLLNHATLPAHDVPLNITIGG